MSNNGTVPAVSIKRIEADGVDVFYREAGASDAPVVLLLHGFPSSSHMYRELIPRLAGEYRVIAPDLPGFGFTNVPAARNYKYSFDALAETIVRGAYRCEVRSAPAIRRTCIPCVRSSRHHLK